PQVHDQPVVTALPAPRVPVHVQRPEERQTGSPQAVIDVLDELGADLLRDASVAADMTVTELPDCGVPFADEPAEELHPHCWVDGYRATHLGASVMLSSA